MEYVKLCATSSVRMHKFVRMLKSSIFLCQTGSLCNGKHQPGSAFTQTCLYPHCKAWVYVQGGLQTKQSVAPAEGSKAGGRAAAALLAVQDSSNEHHVSDSCSSYSWWEMHITCTIAAFAVTAIAAKQLPQLQSFLTCMTAHRPTITANVAREMHM